MRSILTIEKHFSGEFVLGFIEGGGSPTFLSHIAGGRSVRLFLKVWKALEGTQSPLLAVNSSDEVRHLSNWRRMDYCQRFWGTATPISKKRGWELERLHGEPGLWRRFSLKTQG